MANIVIKRKVTLEHLGEEYKDSYLTFKALPVIEYKDLVSRVEKVDGDNEKAMIEILAILEKYFVDGVFDGEKVVKEDIKQFDAETILKCFETLTGQKKDETGQMVIDPKEEPSSTTTSTTEADTAQK